MAKVYSWQVSENPTQYAYIIHPQQVNISDPEIHIGAELTGTMLERVKDWVDSEACTEDVYKTQFQKIQDECPNVKFESVERYLNVSADCDNLRGPSGVGIYRIFLNEEKSTPQISTYTIEYDNGGNDEFQVINGKDGAPGRTGDKGTDGINGVSSKTIMIYKSGSSVKKPEGGSYNFETNEFTAPENWHATNDSNLTPPVWMSSRTFTTSEKSTDKNWSNPIQITGEDGKPGADGTSIEFLYKLSNDKPDIFMLDSPENIDGLKYEPPVDSGWTDSPTGISENNPTEWCTTRKTRKNESGITVWGPWEEPFIWSKYGVNGQDGDGVQYIFLKNSGTLPPNPTPNGYNDNTTTIYREYQNKDEEWIPLLNSTYVNINGDKVENVVIDGTDDAGIWTDSPTDITPIFNSQWVCSRKYRKNNEGIKEWGPYSNPALWGKYGQDGKNATSIRKLYCLSDSTSNPPTLPSDSIITGDWGTGFPLDYVNGENVVWGTEAEIYTDTNEFVMSYKMVSVKKSNDEIIHPNDANYTNTYFADTLPDKEVYGYKYVQYNKMYYSWLGGWCEPYLVTGLKGEPGNQGEQGPAGSPGVAGVPGASSIQMYCLGTYGKNSDNNHYFDTYKNGVDKMGDGYFGSKNWQNDAFVEEMEGWFMTQKIPFSDTIDVVTASDISNVASDEKNDGRVIKYTKVITQGNSVTKEIIYYLIQNKTTIQITSKLSESDDFNVYVWCIQGNEVWERDKNNNNVITGIKWGRPFKVQGTNGLRGLTGKRGQVVYPMGIYNSEEVYVTTDDKAPYVYDPNDGLYYVYNIVNEPWVGILPDNYETIKNEDGTYKYSIDGSGDNDKWITSQNGDTPANNYANAVKNNYNPSWVRFESFQALYTSIGIIANGMIGSAVYNNEFMFSQQGIDKDGNKTNYAVTSGKDTEYGFLSGYKYDEKGKINEKGEVLHWYYADKEDVYINEFDVNPYEKDSGSYIHTFMPNVCINFATGQMWLSTGQIHFGANTRNVSTKDEVNIEIEKIDSKFIAANDIITGQVNTLSSEIDGRFSSIENKFVASDELAGLFSDLVTKEGLVKQSEISTSIQEGIAIATIKADKVNIGGDVNINNILTVDEDIVTMGNANIDNCNVDNCNIDNCNIENCSITDVTINGSLRSPFVLDDNSGTVDSVTHDNVVIHFKNNNATAVNAATEYPYSLQWDTSQNGRKVTIANGLWSDSNGTPEESIGFVKLVAPPEKQVTTTFSGTWFNLNTNNITNVPEDVNIRKCSAYYISRGIDTNNLINEWPTQKAYINVPKGVKTYTFYARRLFRTSANIGIVNPELGGDINTDGSSNKPSIDLTPEVMPGYDVDTMEVTGPFKTKTVYQNEKWTKISVDTLDISEDWTITVSHQRSAPTEYNTSEAQILLPPLITTGAFYEDGIARDHILLSRELVELTGYGDADTFYGWVVTKRTDLNPPSKYGRIAKSILSGSMHYKLSSGENYLPNPILNGPYLRYEKNSEGAYVCKGAGIIPYAEGKYIILLNDNGKDNNIDWGEILSSRHTVIMATGYGTIMKYNSGTGYYNLDENKYPCKACVLPKRTKLVKDDTAPGGYVYIKDAKNATLNYNGFEIWVSDDETTNYGGFNFSIFNMFDSVTGNIFL